MVCPGSTLQKIQGVVVVEDTVTTPHRLKPGPKPLDLYSYLHGRLAAFTTHSDDERIDYVFSSGLVHRLFTTRIEEIPSFFFEHLYSATSIEQFQSLVLHKNMIYEIASSDIDTGDITYSVRGTLTKRFLKEFAVYALELAYAIAKDSVPSRMPERIPEARALFDRLTTTIDGMTLRDALNHSASYTKNNFALRHKLGDTLSLLSDIMTRHFANCFT